MSFNRLIWRLRRSRSTVKVGRLPVELYRPIVEAIAEEAEGTISWIHPERETLRRLCHVSKRFRIEAERMLYRTVHIQSNRGQAHVRLFEYLCSTINPSCPALHVRHFAIQGLPYRYGEHTTYWPRLRDALCAMTNLRHLYLGNYYDLEIAHNIRNEITGPGTTLGTLFLGCRFRLLKIDIGREGGLSPADREILKRQGNVEHWDF